MMRAFVGNDVVDLTDPRTRDKHRDERFVARVLSEEERGILAAAPDPATELWRLWAAKEAAYKVVSKLLGEPPVFVHAAFPVTWAAGAARRRAGLVEHGEVRIPVEVGWDEARVHAVAVSPGVEVAPEAEVAEAGDASLEELLGRLTSREADAVHSPASASVRLAARRDLARRLDVEEARLEIVCAPGVTGRRPPRVLLDGHPATADVSLSHHGRWIAWAILV
ncbi:MAG: hypothetical protein AMXMBFR53_22830 [Gemmatimonadota bacterium]